LIYKKSNVDAEAILLFDMSGSMNQKRLYHATITSMCIFSHILETIGIRYSVYGFSSRTHLKLPKVKRFKDSDGSKFVEGDYCITRTKRPDGSDTVYIKAITPDAGSILCFKSADSSFESFKYLMNTFIKHKTIIYHYYGMTPEFQAVVKIKEIFQKKLKYVKNKFMFMFNDGAYDPINFATILKRMNFTDEQNSNINSKISNNAREDMKKNGIVHTRHQQESEIYYWFVEMMRKEMNFNFACFGINSTAGQNYMKKENFQLINTKSISMNLADKIASLL